MTSWQDQQTRGGAGGAVDSSSGAPMSRREAREAERRAAEALTEKQPHPSGVVDFEPGQYREYADNTDFTPDQEFNVGDTQDIWAALTRGQRPPQTDGLDAFRSGVPEVTAAPRQDSSSVSGELLDRVRDAVLRREATTPPPAAARPATAPQPFVAPQAFQRPEAVPQQPAAFQQPTAFPQPGYPAEDRAARVAHVVRPRSRTSARTGSRTTCSTRAAPRRPRSPSSSPLSRPVSRGYDYEDDGYYDEPYLPEPTIAIPRQATELDAPSHTTNPISLPQAFHEPAGDDAITFSPARSPSRRPSAATRGAPRRSTPPSSSPTTAAGTTRTTRTRRRATSPAPTRPARSRRRPPCRSSSRSRPSSRRSSRPRSWARPARSPISPVSRR